MRAGCEASHGVARTMVIMNLMGHLDWRSANYAEKLVSKTNQVHDLMDIIKLNFAVARRVLKRTDRPREQLA